MTFCLKRGYMLQRCPKIQPKIRLKIRRCVSDAFLGEGC